MSDHHAFFGAARLRRALGHFLIGKGLTAPLTLLNIVLLVRLMPVAGYGAYVTAFAVIEITLALTDLGLSWSAWRFVPSYRVGGGSIALRRFVLQILAMRTVTLALGAAVFWSGAAYLAPEIGLAGEESALRIAAMLILADGLGRFVREILFESLLLQGRIQVGQLLRNIILTVMLLGWLVSGKGELTAVNAMWFELTSAVVSTVLTVVLLFTALKAGNDLQTAGWVPPDIKRLFRLAWPNYLSVLMAYATGPQAMTALVSRMLGADAAGIFGMARNLVDQIRRYLPSELFVGLARPAIIGAYETTRSFEELNRHAQALYKTSYVSLLPFLSISAAVGGLWIVIITGGRYPESHVLFFLFLCTLLPMTQRRVLELVVNVVDHADLWFKAALLGSLSLPLAYLFIREGYGLNAVVIAVLLGEIVTNVMIIWGLAQRGYRYKSGLGRMLAAACASIAAGMLVWLVFPSKMSLLVLLGTSFILTIITGVVVWQVRVFSPHEIELWRKFVRRGAKEAV